MSKHFCDWKLDKKAFGRKCAVAISMLLVSLMTVFMVMPVNAAAPDATVMLDLKTLDGVSALELGVTHTQILWDKGDPEAVSRAKALLSDTVSYNNIHLMGWGTENPQPEEDGPYIWTNDDAHPSGVYLDERIQMMRDLGGEMVITLCTAPGWMKTSGLDWNMGDRLADEHMDDFAALAKAVAERYTDVEYFQVWNEMKGYWDSGIQNSDGSVGNWDYIRYTEMYNKVYNAIKEVRPDAKVGGFYLPISGDGAETLGKSGDGTFMPIGQKDLDALNYWLEHKAGADFICVDRWLKDWHDSNDLTPADHMALTFTYKKVIEDIKQYTDLPIWFSEIYSDRDNPDEGNQYIAAAMASIYYQIIKAEGNSGVVALLWNPTEGEDLVYHYLFTSTEEADGAQQTPHYDVYKGVQDYFSKGIQLYKADSSDPNIEVLASADKMMLINKYDTTKTVSINGNEVYDLAPYEVKFADVSRNVVLNGGFENGLEHWAIGSSETAWLAGDNKHGGSNSINFWSGSSYRNYAENTVESVSPGRYDAKMWVRGGGTVNSVTFEVYGGDTLLKSTDVGISDAWIQYTLEDIDIAETTDVKLRANVDAVSNVWLYFDDFELYQKDAFELEPINVTTEYGIPPELPNTVNAVFDDGSIKQLPVIWDSIDSTDYFEIGGFTVCGEVQGAIAKAIANITVVPVDSLPFKIESNGVLERIEGIKASVTVKKVTGTIDHDGNEVVVFQLMKKNTPVSIVAMEKDITSDEPYTAYFNVPNYKNPSYNVKVFVFDKLSPDTGVPENLADPANLD